MKYDYYIKKVPQTGLKDHLRIAGYTGWKLVQIVVIQEASYGLGQAPSIKVYYECIMIRRQNGHPLENDEIEKEISDGQVTDQGKKEYNEKIKK